MELKEILSQIQDECNPAAWDNLFLHVEEIREDDQFYLEMLLERIQPMDIYWTLPWYQVSKSMTEKPNLSNDNDEKDHYREDKFTEDEWQHVMKRWNKLIKKYDVPNRPESIARFRTKNRVGQTQIDRLKHFVIAFLARGLQRTLHQVYSQFVRKVPYKQKGPYTEDEMKFTELLIENFPHKAPLVSTLYLERNPRHIYHRVSCFRNGKPKNVEKGKWSLNKATHLLNLLLKYTGKELHELKNAPISRDVWLNLEKDMENKVINLRRFWYNKLHVQLFLEKDLKFKRIRKKIFKKLIKSPYKVWGDIEWKVFVNEFPTGCTSSFLYYIAIRSFDKHKDVLKRPLKEAADFMLTQPWRKNRRVRRLTLDDEGQLVPLPKVKMEFSESW